jgi:hypothetical protein
MRWHPELSKLSQHFRFHVLREISNGTLHAVKCFLYESSSGCDPCPSCRCWWGYSLTRYFWILEGPRLGVVVVSRGANLVQLLLNKGMFKWQIYLPSASICSSNKCLWSDRFCGLVVRVPGYRSRGSVSIPGATRFPEK